MVTLTHHKKSVRALAIHPTEYSFASGSAGGNNIKKWKCPEGAFVFNFSGHNAIINTLSVNAEGVFFSGGTFRLPHIASGHDAVKIYAKILKSKITGDNGTLTFWDYNTGTPFQNMDDVPQPGSLEAEAGVFCSTFDQTGTRLITGGADKTIKVGCLCFPVGTTKLIHRVLPSRSTQSSPNSLLLACPVHYTSWSIMIALSQHISLFQPHRCISYFPR